MELNNDFTIAGGLDQAWSVLTDLTRVVPCLPGASLDSVDGDAFTGRMSIKLGPMRLSYRGDGKIAPDQATRSIVVDARGGEERGSGSAAATITAALEPLAADRVQVRVTTDLDLTGKPAQFGRGIMMDVASRLLGTFAENLERELQASAASSPDERASTESSHLAGSSAPLDLGAASLVPILKRAVPLVVAGIVGGLVLRRLLRRARD